MSAQRRSYGTGRLYQKHGAYYGRWRTSDGHRLNRRIGPVRAPGSRDGLARSEAERRFRRMQQEEENRPPAALGGSATVTEAADSLRSKLSLEGARKSYLGGCRSMQRVHIDPRLGTKSLTKVSTADVEAVASAMLASGLKPKSVHNVLVFLHGVFEHAIERGWTNDNPVRRAARPRRRRARGANPDLQFLTMSELEAVLRAIPDDVVQRAPPRSRRGRAGPAPPPPADVLGPVLRVLVLTAAMSGLRRSELLGLRWRDVDWQAQRLRVRNAYVLGEHSTAGKSDLSTRRSVPMTDRLAGELDRWSQRTLFGGDAELVFAASANWKPPGRDQGDKAVQGGLPRGRGPTRSLSRPTPHLRHAPGCLRPAAARHPGVPRPRRREDHPDLRSLRALRARGRDGQRRVLQGRGDGVQFGVQIEDY
jgi:integrase